MTVVTKVTKEERDQEDKEMNLREAIERAVDKCNLIGEECDVYSVLYSYKTIRQLPDEEIEKIYDYIVAILGY